jgi:hypothetical protein
MVYRWLDYLEDELSGDGRLVGALRRFGQGTLAGEVADRNQ